jgi:hypothetical protein
MVAQALERIETVEYEFPSRAEDSTHERGSRASL